MNNGKIIIFYRAISRLYFHLPILFLFLWKINLSYFEVMVIMAVYGLSSNIAPIIINKISQKISSKELVQLGEALKFLGLFLLVVGSYPGIISIYLLLLGQCIGGIGFSISLSADNSLLKEISINQENMFQLQSKSQSLMFVSTLFAGFIGGILFSYNPFWPIFAGMLVSLMSILVISLINSTTSEKKDDEYKSINILLYLDKESMKWVRYYAILRAFALAPFIGLLPLYFALRQLDPFLFGLVLGLFTLGGFIFSIYGRFFLDKINPKIIFLFIVTMLIISYSFFLFEIYLYQLGFDAFYLPLIGIFFLGMTSGSIRPIIIPKIDFKNIEKQKHIFVFLYMEKLFGYINTVILLSMGLILTQYNVEYMFFLIIVILLIIAIKEWDIGKRIKI